MFEVEATTRKEQYVALLDAYMQWGGFPMAVAECIRGKTVGDETIGVYRSVMFSEFEKQRRSIPVFMGLMRKLYRVLGAPVSYNSLTQDTGCRSNGVVQDYLGIFSGAFLGFEVPCIDLVHRRPFPKREKKFYAIDPILWKITAEHAGLLAVQKAALAEQAAAAHLVRPLADRWAGLGSLEGLYYFRSRKGNEVDFVLLNTPADTPFGVEIKYQAKVSGVGRTEHFQGDRERRTGHPGRLQMGRRLPHSPLGLPFVGARRRKRKALPYVNRMGRTGGGAARFGPKALVGETV